MRKSCTCLQLWRLEAWSWLILCWPASVDETASRQKKQPTFAGIVWINGAGRDGRQHRDETWAPFIRQLFFGSVNLNGFAQIYEESVLISECTTVFTHVDPVAHLKFREITHFTNADRN